MGGCIAAGVLAQTQPIFGPVTFTLPNTNLVSVSDSFDIPPSATGPYLLRVKLSAPNSLNTLSFKLNNVQVLALADFSGGKTQVEKAVVVQPHNTFSLQLKGQKNTKITVTVFATPNLPKPTTLAPNPLAVTAGTSGNLTATLSPTPATAGMLAVSSANSGIASVPVSAPFAAGQAQVVIPVSGVSAGSTNITASLNGGSASATVNVVLPPAVLTSLQPASPTMNAGASGSFTVTISPAQAAATAIILSIDQPALLQAPQSVVVDPGQTSVVFTVSALAAGNATLTAALNGTQQISSVRVLALPSIFGQTPKDETLPGATQPHIAAQYSSADSAIDLNSVRLRLDGQDITSLATVTETAVFYQVTQPLAVAVHTVSVTAANIAGGAATATWSFTLDDPAPNFFSETPRDVFIADRRPRIRVLLSGFNIVLSSVRIQLDGADVTAQSDVGTGHIVFIPADPLADGNHTVSVAATDERGATAGKQWSFTVELPPPSVADDGVRTERTVTPEITVLP